MYATKPAHYLPFPKPKHHIIYAQRLKTMQTFVLLLLYNKLCPCYFLSFAGK